MSVTSLQIKNVVSNSLAVKINEVCQEKATTVWL